MVCQALPLSQPLWHPEGLAYCLPDDFDVLAVGERLVDGPAAEISQNEVLRDALGIDIAELLPHPLPEHRQPHVRQANRRTRAPTNAMDRNEHVPAIASMPVDLSARRWPPMLWIGGGQGAGKSTLSWHLARANDLPLHPVDLWAYDHQARLPAGDSLDEQLARGAEAAADAFESAGRLRLGLVVDDILRRDLGLVPAVVEGPQLMPGFAAWLSPGWGVWLLPDPARARLVREERLARQHTLARRPPNDRNRAHRLGERDALLAERIRRSAALSGWPVIEVPPLPDWPAIAADVESALAPGLRSAPRLAPGTELSQQRRYENQAADRQGRLWMKEAELAVMPSYPFGCECGQSGCSATWTATPDDYATRTSSEGLLITHGTRDS